jgi:DNA polymerase-3 subunit epsilon
LKTEALDWELPKKELPMTSRKGLADRVIRDTPVAIIDFETTGLNAGVDRVVEVSVVRVEPGQKPELVLDTLVNPERRMAATDIHGITEEDVAGAPRFEEIAGNLVKGLYDCIIAAYNVYFDIGFLEYELGKAGLKYSPPYLCLMYLRPMIGLGSRCSLDDACRFHCIEYSKKHRASADALAGARLWNLYLEAIKDRKVRTFKELATLKSYKFIQSFERDPLVPPVADNLKSTKRLKSRRIPVEVVEAVAPVLSRQDVHHSYWEALKTVLSDLEVAKEEIAYLTKKKQELGLAPEEVRSLHARAFADLISQCVEDKELSDDECSKLRRLHQCLGKLGWAPGE